MQKLRKGKFKGIIQNFIDDVNKNLSKDSN